MTEEQKAAVEEIFRLMRENNISRVADAPHGYRYPQVWFLEKIGDREYESPVALTDITERED